MENTTMPTAENTTPETAAPKKDISRIGKYTIVDLDELENIRAIWKNEARDFTPWMSQPEIMKRLGEALGFNNRLCGIKREHKNERSERRCDIVARLHSEDDDDETQDEIVAIENQLEETDFDHLGRVILYAALNNATRLVWVVKDASYDCRKAIAWLNKNTTESLRFYLVEVSVYDLQDNNRVAPIFRLVEGPDEEEKAQKSNSKRYQRNFDFWKGFREFALDEKLDDKASKANRERLNFIPSFRQPTGDNWYGISFGTGKCHIDLWDSHNRVDFSIQTYEQETFDTIKSIMPELKEAVGQVMPDLKRAVEQKEDSDYFGKKDIKRPRIRFCGPACDIEKKGSDDAKQKAYEWLMLCLEAVVPKIQKVLNVR